MTRLKSFVHNFVGWIWSVLGKFLKKTKHWDLTP